MHEAFVNRFWDNVQVGPENECWPWRGATAGIGYGCTYAHLGERTAQIGAHRIAYLLARDELRQELYVCHSCDNPPCCNPRHLWQGAHKENTADMVAKGRHGFGAKNGQAKLTEKQARDIRARYLAGESSYLIARAFGVCPVLVQKVGDGLLWKHLDSLPARRRGRLDTAGGNNSRAILSEADVLEIRRRYARGETQHSLAATFAVSRSAIEKVVSWRSWTHVGGERRSR